jgi:hypothetical protein
VPGQHLLLVSTSTLLLTSKAFCGTTRVCLCVFSYHCCEPAALGPDPAAVVQVTVGVHMRTMPGAFSLTPSPPPPSARPPVPYLCSEPAVVKLEVGVHMPTQPGQRVLLVGDHPILGSWDLRRAWKLRWSDGHIWRGCLELPAHIGRVEFKVGQLACVLLGLGRRSSYTVHTQLRFRVGGGIFCCVIVTMRSPSATGRWGVRG